ncbi:MAG: YggS family pyridoxal phosphate-dependent enzyme [Parvularculaceae bacterium]|nr:YggS family pyridoxal phosphate-dependent enzyme [Parvularculaceae bacterium]
MDRETLIRNRNDVLESMGKAALEAHRDASDITLNAVSKTFDADQIRPLLEAGHRVFGENRVQESQQKWPGLKDEFPDVELHLIGPLQSNKAKDAVALFDVIETVDRPKIAAALAKEMAVQDRHLPVYVQVNTGEEEQKAGIRPQDTTAFVSACRDDHGLNVVGLMAIPPVDQTPAPHFALLAKLAEASDLPKLSMGMSADYEAAVSLGSTIVRVGSGIFGARTAAQT